MIHASANPDDDNHASTPITTQRGRKACSVMVRILMVVITLLCPSQSTIKMALVSRVAWDGLYNRMKIFKIPKIYF